MRGLGMFATKVKSFAKLNLCLSVQDVACGYHLLDGVAATIDIYDTICVKPRSDKLINVYMHGKGSESIPPEKNNAVKAGEAFVDAFGTKGADIEIYKDIPMGAGLGGSSADAAGVLNAMAKRYKIKDRTALKEIADSLGSDTGYLLTGGFARLTGRGEKVQPLNCPKRLNFLLILPKSGVSTAECFREYDRMPVTFISADKMSEAIGAGDFEGIAASVSNALQAPAARLNQEVEEALKAAEALSPSAYAVTGSGSCVYLLYETEELCRWAKSRYKGKCRTRVVKTVDPNKKSNTRWANPFVLTEEEIEAARENDED